MYQSLQFADDAAYRAYVSMIMVTQYYKYYK